MKKLLLALALGGFAVLPSHAQEQRPAGTGVAEPVQVAQLYRERWERYPRAMVVRPTAAGG